MKSRLLRIGASDYYTMDFGDPSRSQRLISTWGVTNPKPSVAGWNGGGKRGSGCLFIEYVIVHKMAIGTEVTLPGIPPKE